jgi:bifunctional ADP-heptose synthase (sugar kinase/adenylyltransferase)
VNEDSKLISYPSDATDVVDLLGATYAYLAAASTALKAVVSLKVAMFFASILGGKVIGEMGTGNSLQLDELWKTLEALTK